MTTSTSSSTSVPVVTSHPNGLPSSGATSSFGLNRGPTTYASSSLQPHSKPHAKASVAANNALKADDTHSTVDQASIDTKELVATTTVVPTPCLGKCDFCANKISRLWLLLKFALVNDLGAFRPEANRLEKVGDFGLKPAKLLPLCVVNVLCDPRVVTIALTAFTMFVVSCICFPSTIVLAKMAVRVIPAVPVVVYKAAFVFAEITILAIGVRALGRFWNTELKVFCGIEQKPLLPLIERPSNSNEGSTAATASASASPTNASSTATSTAAAVSSSSSSSSASSTTSSDKPTK